MKIGEVGNITEKEVASLCPITSAATIIAACYFGIYGVADRNPKIYVLSFGFFLGCVSMIVLLFADGYDKFAIFAFLFGTSYGTQYVVNLSIWSELYGRKELGKFSNFLSDIMVNNLAAGHFEQNQQKLCKNQSDDAHICNI